jgi:hypothetical protein
MRPLEKELIVFAKPTLLWNVQTKAAVDYDRMRSVLAVSSAVAFAQAGAPARLEG